MVQPITCRSENNEHLTPPCISEFIYHVNQQLFSERISLSGKNEYQQEDPNRGKGTKP
jgi:hypothetical protein